MASPTASGWNTTPHAPTTETPSTYGYDPNVAEAAGTQKDELSFDDKSIRATFVRKVFALVGVMLAIVTFMTAIPMIHKPIMDYLHKDPNGGLFYFISFVVFFVVYFALMCCESVRRSFPSNIICTMILAVTIGYMTMMLASFHNPETVLLCLAITTVGCGGVIVFSMQTRVDFTKALGWLIAAFIMLLIFGLVAAIAIIFFKVKVLYTVYSGLMALIFMAFLAIDIQMIMGGRKYEISPEEHIFAAIQIFLDIVIVFWYLLRMFR